MNTTMNLRANLIELVERNDIDAIRVLLAAYQGQSRHEQLIRLAISRVERSLKGACHAQD